MGQACSRRDPKRYDFERVFAAAELGFSLKPGEVPELKKYLSDADSGVRYWGAAGILMRGQAAVDTSKTGLLAALADSSASVRVAAAEALGRYGDEADRFPFATIYHAHLGGFGWPSFLMQHR